MIFVDRQRTHQGQPILPPQSWFDKAAEKTAKALDEKEYHKADDGVYARDDVRAALEKLFHNKCAYCESRPTGNASWDVEHYRPKGAVKENPKHPGYYWLAYDWDNLYLSCMLCNQARKDKPTFDDPTTGPTAGKKDQFPLDDESKRAMDHNSDINAELPLLLDPCVDDPERHITFGVTAEAIPIDDDVFAAESIRILHLNRRRLKEDRGIVLRNAITVAKNIRTLGQQGNADGVAAFRDLLDQLAGDEQPFAGAVRAVRRDPAAFGIA